MFGLEDRHVVITGAGGGIGRALVAAFGAAGARITALDRDAALLEPLPVAARLAFDLADPDALRESLADFPARHGAPDVVVSNAGWTRAESFADLDPAAWDKELAINLTGAYGLVDALLPGMKERGGALVFVASVNGLGHFGNPAYSAAKAGLLALMRGLAVELGAENIRANAVCPGSVMTPAWDHRFARDPGLRERVLTHYPLGRLVTPAEVAQAVLFLASPLAAGITGVAVPVDAGLTAGHLGFVRDIVGGPA